MSNFLNHLDREWSALGWPKEHKTEEDPQVWVYQDLKELLNMFSRQGHSGSSAPYIISLFSKIAMFKPLGPLTGGDSEWNEVGEEGGEILYQNNRCSHVFKHNNRAYDINGKVFEESDGHRYTNSNSEVPVTFPYTPKTEIIKV